VLIVLQGVHQEIPDLKTASQAVYVGPPPPASPSDTQPASAQDGSNTAPALATDADKIREHYKDLGDAQGHKFGENPPGSKPVDFNFQLKPGDKPVSTTKPNPTAKAPASPAAKPDDQ
jgi:hypothetical protein